MWVCCGEWGLELLKFADNGELINRIRSQTWSPHLPAGVEWSAQARMENPFHKNENTAHIAADIECRVMNEGISRCTERTICFPASSELFRIVESTRGQQRSRHKTDPFHSALHCAGNRRAGGERWEWHGGQGCYRYPRRGIAAHITAVVLFCFFSLPAELFTQQASYMRNVIVFTQMCSPAQLRQQSEELYAVIDDVLARSTPIVSSDKWYQMSKSCLFINLFSCIYVCFQL